MKKIIATLLTVSFICFTSGCANMGATEKGAIVGAGVGAVVGGLVSKDHPAEGALIGAAVGAIAGAVIGHYIDKKQKSAEETATVYDYQPEEGTVVNIEEVAMEPAEIRPGEASRLVINYAILSPDAEKAIPVTEIREIKSSGKSLKEIGPAVKKRNSGTYITEQEVTFPANLPEGVYTLKGTVEAEGKTSTKETDFRVAKIKKGSEYLYAINMVE
ncbi:putative 17 kDa surface antigen [uncultured Desulfobacterium sp.]|uniref:Putative 17 kDa surface antigen n=1 Tax=uncultured Desulfobacterium sp. TaxID=201089 RepID=A0A445MVX1_9BACT|nr:putative 17 kDa surface antigen [uncultured Desulfobacterium sp.]